MLPVVPVLPAVSGPVRAAGTAMEGSCWSARAAPPVWSARAALSAWSARAIQVARSLRKTAMAPPEIGRGDCHYGGAGAVAQC
ncbi:hypothetical protein Vqi01_20740 [Micromonospora qiuiae]|uniref:Secreted protein n=1 Tax=Micromonospora qiuiae TaxID=502268 RepID=A0ABQ4J9Z0_9ACTN|nr:hypothetical protein Vqi01_20740 [Micromonospora qiuiae]